MIAKAGRVALVVGTALVAINQSTAALHGPLHSGLLLRVGLNYAVPFLVSLYSMVGVVPELRPGQRGKPGGVYRCRNCPGRGHGQAVVSAGDALPSCPRCGVAACWIPTRA